MNRSEVLKAMEWVDQAARDGDVTLLAKAKVALETELKSKRNLAGPEEGYKIAHESFVRKHGREPYEEMLLE
ncbi:MAG: hypothetical protein AB1733_13740 [Thermodesulfobacteriota bacterium]